MIRVYSYIRVKVRSGKADVRDSRYRREPDGGKCRTFRVDGPAWCRQQIDSRGSDEDERSRRLNGQLLLRWTDGRTDGRGTEAMGEKPETERGLLLDVADV